MNDAMMSAAPKKTNPFRITQRSFRPVSALYPISFLRPETQPAASTKAKCDCDSGDFEGVQRHGMLPPSVRSTRQSMTPFTSGHRVRHRGCPLLGVRQT